MRTIDSVTSVIKPSNFAWWHRSWTGRFVLAALLIAAAAFALMPDRTAAHQSVGDSIEDHCKAQDNAGPDGITIPADDVSGFGVIPGNIFNKDLQSDCIALLTAAEMLNDVGDQYDWIVTGDEQHNTGGNMFNGVDINIWDGVTVGVPIDATDTNQRVTAVSLTNGELTGTLAPEWADLDKLTLLNISGHDFTDPNPTDADGDTSHDGLTGSPSRSLWAFLGGLTTLNLSGNPDLAPSLALGLTADVTKGESGTDVALSWDNIGWYTNSETRAAATTGERTTHKFKYRRLTGVNADGDETWGEYEDVAVGTAVTKERSSADAMKLLAADTYSFQVVTVKTTYVDSDNDGDDGRPGGQEERSVAARRGWAADPDGGVHVQPARGGGLLFGFV